MRRQNAATSSRKLHTPDPFAFRIRGKYNWRYMCFSRFEVLIWAR